jgi:endoglucanase
MVLLAPFVDEVSVDVMGNVIGVRRCGKENARKLMLEAHMDEIGLIVTGVEEGYLKFSALGGVDSRILPASELKILTDEPIPGVIGVMPPHVLKPEDSDKTIKLEDLTIDVGLPQEAAEKKIPLGTPAVFRAVPGQLGRDAVCGKALDDRAGLAAILQALELLKDVNLDVDLYVLASVQEEVGTRGAKTGAFSVMPDWCISIDVDHAKTPDCKDRLTKEFGGGVVIALGPNMNRHFSKRAIALAEEKGISFQIGVESGDSGTDARVIQITQEGGAPALFMIPLKYMHTPVEVVSLRDTAAAAELLSEVAKSLKGDEFLAGNAP